MIKLSSSEEQIRLYSPETVTICFLRPLHALYGGWSTCVHGLRVRYPLVTTCRWFPSTRFPGVHLKYMREMHKKKELLFQGL